MAGMFLLAGAPKLLQVPVWVDKFGGWGYAKWFLVAIGGIEVICAVLLLIPALAFYGTAVLGVVMIGATYTHVANSEGWEVLRPLIFLFVLVAIAWARRPRRPIAA
jgi:uncharacterized membrane protein YphA (DoxX/SURF4 family)